MQAVVTEKAKPLFQDTRFVTNRSSINAYLHTLGPATQGTVLADSTPLLATPNPVGTKALPLPEAVVVLESVKSQTVVLHLTEPTTKVLTSPEPVYTTTVRQKARRILINEKV